MRHTNEPTEQLSELKELLFEDERQEIKSLGDKVEDLDSRFGSSEKFESAVAASLATAFRRAEIDNHRQLAAAVSPLVLAAIRQEISQSREMMVEALYPITGRLVSTAVAKAFRQFLQDINDRIEAVLSPRLWKLRLKALITRRPLAELVLAEATSYRVQQMLLIDREDGTLLAHYPDETATPDAPNGAAADPDLVGGLLTAIIDFSQEAFAAEGGELRSIDLGGRMVFLRASPGLTVAAIGLGATRPATEQVVDDAFMAFLDDRAESTSDDATRHDAALSALKDRIDTALAPGEAPKRNVFGKIVVATVVVALVALAGYWGAGVLEAVRLDRQLAALESYPEFGGYPLVARFDSADGTVRVRGVAPSVRARSNVEKEARRIAAGYPVDSRITVDSTPQLRRRIADGETRAIELGEHLAAMDAALAENAASLAQLTQRADKLRGDLLTLREAIGTDRKAAIDPLTERIDAAVAGIGNLERQLKAADLAARERIEVLARDIRDDLDTLASDLSELNDGLAGKANVDDLAKTASEVSVLIADYYKPARKLSEFVERQSIFFADGVEFRNNNKAGEKVRQLAKLLTELPNTRIRIVGYADELGGVMINRKIARERASAVAAELLALGISAERLVVVGRPESAAISDSVGRDSTNRRVGFEIAFIGE
ncbi:MAG: OmpA family protein [Hyphomicrobiales bacterium]|nr:OmpA family protein [Hyphomicrobiales bacterium]